MYQAIKNLFCKSVDAVMAVGRSIKSFFSPAIKGEYLGKGGVNLSRRSFFSSGSLAVSMTVCFVLLPAVGFAAVPASVTTGISDAVTDVTTIGAAILGVIIVIAAFAWMRRMVK